MSRSAEDGLLVNRRVERNEYFVLEANNAQACWQIYLALHRDVSLRADYLTSPHYGRADRQARREERGKKNPDYTVFASERVRM